MSYPAVPEKWRYPSLHGPEQFLGGALAAGWDPGEIPEGAVFVFDHRLRTYVEQRPGSVEAPELAPGNARVFRIGRAIISCLSPGAGTVVTQTQNLAYLGTTQFVIVGTAGSISPRLRPGATVIPNAAVRDDGNSQHYLRPCRLATPSQLLSGRLHELLPHATSGVTWTVATPYRITLQELEIHGGAGVVAVEMEAAALFAVAEAIAVQAAAALVISDVTTPSEHVEDWVATSEPLVETLEAALRAVAG